MSDFGERLKFFRLNILKMKRKEFCEKYSIPVISVQGWENNGIKISKRQIEKLESKFNEDGVEFDPNWLFLGEGQPWDVLKSKVAPNKDNSSYSNCEEIDYRVETYFYEPLFKKNSNLTLERVNLKDINCPSFIALKDTLGNMHLGILTLTLNKKYIMEAFQGNFYRLVPDDKDTVFLIKNISLYE